MWTYESCERGYGIANSQPVGAVELSHPSALIAYNGTFGWTGLWGSVSHVMLRVAGVRS